MHSPEGVLDEVERVEDDLRNQLHTLSRTGMVDTPLQNTTPMSVSRNFDKVGSNGVVDELVIFRYELVEAFLNHLHRFSKTHILVKTSMVTHMVTVQILDERHNIHTQRIDQRSDLLRLPRLRQEIHHLLNCPRAMHIQADPNKVVRDRMDNSTSLIFGTILKQLLAEVVAKRVDHKFGEMSVCLGKDHISVRRVAIFECLLKISAAVLIFAKG